MHFAEKTLIRVCYSGMLPAGLTKESTRQKGPTSPFCLKNTFHVVWNRWETPSRPSLLSQKTLWCRYAPNKNPLGISQIIWIPVCLYNQQIAIKGLSSCLDTLHFARLPSDHRKYTIWRSTWALWDLLYFCLYLGLRWGPASGSGSVLVQFKWVCLKMVSLINLTSFFMSACP